MNKFEAFSAVDLWELKAYCFDRSEEDFIRIFAVKDYYADLVFGSCRRFSVAS